MSLHLTYSLLFLSPPGVFDECDTEVNVLLWSRHNVFLLYDMGIFTALLELLSMEIEWVGHRENDDDVSRDSLIQC